MKNIYKIFVSIFIFLGIFVFSSSVLSAPTSNIFRTILPETDSLYNIGSDSLRWSNVFSDNINTSNIFLPSFSQGSVLFTGSSGMLIEDNVNFYWDNTNKRLGIGKIPLSGLDVIGTGDFTGIVSYVITGTTDPTASTTLVGTGTKFLTELEVGDRITVNAETRTVSAIASDTSLTVSTAFTDTAGGATITRLSKLFNTKDSNNITKVHVMDNGTLVVNKNSINLVNPNNNSSFYTAGADSADNIFYMDVFQGVANFNFRRANGTAASPSAILSQENIGQFVWIGYRGTAYNNNSAAKIAGYTEADWDDTNNPAQLRFYTRASGTSGATQKMVLTGAGYLGMGSTSPVSILEIKETTGAISTITRNDTSITANDSVGKINFRAADTSTTTNFNVAEIEAQATNTVTTDINPGRLIFRTTPTGVAATPTEALRITEIQNVGIGGVTSPTARIHLPAGTSSASTAPLKFTSGTSLGTAETGAVEYDGTSLFFTRTGTTREVIGTVVTKTTTGDGTGAEGLFQINTFDNTFKVYAEGGWRSITTW